MKYNNMSFAPFAIVLILIMTAFSFTQTEKKDIVKSVELGVQLSGLSVNRIEAGNEVLRRFGVPSDSFNDSFVDSGVGGRLTYNINRSLAFETEINYFPSRPTFNELNLTGQTRAGSRSGGKKTQFLAGVKYGIRRSRYGIFGKARPGAINLTGFPQLVDLVIIPFPKADLIITTTREVKTTFFNIDVGGVFEYYPTRNTIFRVDVGDTIIRYHAQPPKEISPTFTRHNLQTSIGFGYRF